ncbi:MAG: hypothetical protein V4593_08230 [Pseudomonadota bacterium]
MAAFIQISETQNQVGKAGHIAASSKGYIGSTLARVVEANVNAGLGLVSGATKGKTVKAPASAADVRNLFEGVLLDPEFKNDINAAADLLAGQQASVLEEGYVWVQVEGSPAIGGDVYVRHTSDGGSNTVLGKFRGDRDGTGGLVITPPANYTQVIQTYALTFTDGVNVETFSFTTDASPTTAEVAAGLVALIDASANFASTGATTIGVTSTLGPVEVVGSLPAGFALATSGRAERLPGATFRSTFGTDAGGLRVAQIRLPAK